MSGAVSAQAPARGLSASASSSATALSEPPNGNSSPRETGVEEDERLVVSLEQLWTIMSTARLEVAPGPKLLQPQQHPQHLSSVYNSAAPSSFAPAHAGVGPWTPYGFDTSLGSNSLLGAGGQQAPGLVASPIPLASMYGFLPPVPVQTQQLPMQLPLQPLQQPQQSHAQQASRESHLQRIGRLSNSTAVESVKVWASDNPCISTSDSSSVRNFEVASQPRGGSFRAASVNRKRMTSAPTVELDYSGQLDDDAAAVKKALVTALVARTASTSTHSSSSKYVSADAVLRSVPGAGGYAEEFRTILCVFEHIGIVEGRFPDESSDEMDGGQATTSNTALSSLSESCGSGRRLYRWLGPSNATLRKFFRRVNATLTEVTESHDDLVKQGLLPPRILLMHVSPFSLVVRVFEIFVLCRADSLPESTMLEFFAKSHREKASQTLRWLVRCGVLSLSGSVSSNNKPQRKRGRPSEAPLRYTCLHADSLLQHSRDNPSAVMAPNQKNKKAVRKCRNMLNLSSFRYARTWPKFYLDKQKHFVDL